MPANGRSEMHEGDHDVTQEAEEDEYDYVLCTDATLMREGSLQIGRTTNVSGSKHQRRSQLRATCVSTCIRWQTLR